MSIFRYNNNAASSRTFALLSPPPGYLMVLINFLFFMILLSSFGIAMQEEQRLVFPHPKKLYLKPLRNDATQEEIDVLIKEGITLKLLNPTLQKVQQAIGLFKQAAEQGDSQGMFFIGKTCEEHGELGLAVRWYTLAFQNQWFKDPTDASKSSSYNSLKKLENEPQIEIKNFLLIHVFNIDTPVQKFGRYSALIHFYGNKTAEPYLDEKENQLKIERLKKEASLISDFSCEVAQNYFNSGVKFSDNKFKLYEDAKKCFLKSSFPDALYNLGWLYEEGCIGTKNGQPDYQEAFKYYEMAKTVKSFASLGRFYKNGNIGKIDDKPNYEKAVKYLKYSGDPAALSNLGILFQKGHVGQIDDQPDYQTAKSYFEKSGTDDAYVRLGELYMLGYIGKNFPQPDYQQAAYCFEIAARNGYPSAFCKLGHLYLQGHIDTIYGQPDYKSAIAYFEQATESSDLSIKSNSFYNLGAAYVKGHIGQIEGQPDYKKAKIYFDQSTMPESYYNIGNLYEWGHIGTEPDYINALEYYQLSNLTRAQMAILGLYQLGYVKPNKKEEKQKIINNIVEKINGSLSTLSLDESYYIKGIAEYYLGNWEAALISLQNALALGNVEEELSQLIDEIGEALEKEARKEEEEQEKVTKLILEPAKEKVQITDKLEIKHETLDLPIMPIEKEKLEKNVISESESQTIHIKKEKLTKERKSILKAYQSKHKFLSFKDVGSKSLKISQLPLQFNFLSEENKINFESIKSSNSKLQEVLQDIQNNCWATTGAGKPEVLKYPFKGYKGCLSRRLNGEDRLVYKVVKSGVVLILSWEGHYL